MYLTPTPAADDREGDLPDLEALRRGEPAPPDSQIPVRRVELPSHQRRRDGRFIPPVPLLWYQRACRLPGKAPVVAAVLWYLRRVRKSHPVALTQTTLSEFGVTRSAKYRALRALGAAGLIAVRRRRCKNPEVTILDPAADAA
jgi:hypothetical protein